MAYKFGIINKNTVQNLETLRRRVLKKRAISWSNKKISSQTLQAIRSGASVTELAQSYQNVLGMEKRWATNNARTSFTSAENGGRYDSAVQASDDGIIVQKEWISTIDDSTRDSHLMMDGKLVDADTEFSNGLMYPGDPNGDAEEIYNCRCTMGEKVIGFKSDKGETIWV